MNIRARSHERGEAGFDEARTVALERINNPILAPRIAAALSSRFREVIVDEAQDCNPADLTIISWFRNSGISTSYHRYLSDNDIKPESWRPKVIQILRDLRFDPVNFCDARSWHDHAKSVLGRNVTLATGDSISQKLKWNADIETVLYVTPTKSAMARTIHSVKGLEFPAVCVVTTASKLNGILEFLETGAPADQAEDARELYVAASRAQKLLVFASPKSQASRFSSHLRKQGAEVTVTEI